MRCLAVYLSTAGDVTYVLLLFSWVAKVKNKQKKNLNYKVVGGHSMVT